MDKGKKPIQKEEDFLSLVNDYHSNNMILSRTPLTLPEFNIFSEGSGTLPKEITTASIVDEMYLVDKEDLFSKLLSTNLVEFSDPPLKQNSILPESNTGVFPIAQADDHLLLISQKQTGKPPRPPPAAADDKDNKPPVFRKAMPPDVLAEVAIYDPKRARRIVTNRISAIRAKEKKKLYMYMLEHKMHTFQSKSTKLIAQLTLLETEGTTLNAENKILKDRVEIILKQLRLQDSLNDQIRSEIQHMKTVLGQNIPNLGALIGLYGGNSNQDINKPFGAAHQLPEFQLLQIPYQEEQQVQFDLQQQPLPPFAELHNFGVHQVKQGECRQLQQQIHPENPNPFDHYQRQNEQAQDHQLQQLLPEVEHIDARSVNVG